MSGTRTRDSTSGTATTPCGIHTVLWISKAVLPPRSGIHRKVRTRVKRFFDNLELRTPRLDYVRVRVSMSSSIKVIFAFNKQSALAVADAQPKIAPPQPPAERNKSCPLDFWISPRMALIAIALLFCLTEALAPLIPPIQSPDEAAHLERAYLLSKGEIFLRTRDGITGGEIDTGLLSYMNSFLALPLNYEHKVKTVDLRRARKIQWTGVRRFDGLPNTAAYFPLPYTPQAVAFALSERAGLTVYQSYSLARILSLVVTLNLLWIACRIHPIPPVVAALFVMPMTLFQLASASLDAITFAMTAVTAGLFLRGADSRPFNG